MRRGIFVGCSEEEKLEGREYFLGVSQELTLGQGGVFLLKELDCFDTGGGRSKGYCCCSTGGGGTVRKGEAVVGGLRR